MLGGQLVLEVVNLNVIWTTAPIMYKPIHIYMFNYIYTYVQTCINQ